MNKCKHGVILYGARCLNCEREKQQGVTHDAMAEITNSPINDKNKSLLISKYKRLRHEQIKIDQIMNHRCIDMTHVIRPDEARSKLSNAIDQIEQVLELIKKANTDSVVAEILIEIDGEFKL